MSNVKKQSNNSDVIFVQILSQFVSSIMISLMILCKKMSTHCTITCEQPKLVRLFFSNFLKDFCVSSETGSWNVQSGDRSICWRCRCLKSQQSGGAVCVTTPDISPVVILRWERMCSLRLMTCLSKRKSPPFSEAQQLPSSRERNKIKQRRLRTVPIFACCSQRTEARRPLKWLHVNVLWRSGMYHGCENGR